VCSRVLPPLDPRRPRGRRRARARAAELSQKRDNSVPINARALAAGEAVRTVDRVRLSLLDLAVALVVAALLLTSLSHCGGSGEAVPAVLASPTLTPGSLNPAVTQATIGSTICVRGWTRTIRPPSSYTSALKVEQMATYRLTGSPSGYQEDHLVSLELGGHPTDPRNLWPQPYPRAAEVDQIENELNEQVCSGKLTLAEAQRIEADLKHERG
jgi:hypothetical protein